MNLGGVADGRILPSFKEFIQILSTFGLTVLAWIFFRAENIQHAFSYISEIFSPSLFSVPAFSDLPKVGTVAILLLVFIVIEWMGRRNEYAIEHLGLKWKAPIRYAFYYILILALFYFGGQEQQFIYFQF